MSAITIETIPKIVASAQAVISALWDQHGPERGIPVAMLMSRDVALALAVTIGADGLSFNGGNELAGIPVALVPNLRGIHAILPDGSTALVWP